MKTNKFFQLLTLAICAVIFAFVTGCEGPEGPVGPKGDKGDQGEQGLKGDDGTPGVAGTAGCLECHSSDVKYQVTVEYESSGHAQGVAAVYVDGRSNCAVCHSNEGFIEGIWTGEDVTATNLAFSTRISCATCHKWHNESLDLAEAPDYALRTNDPVDLLMYRAYRDEIPDLPTVSFDSGDNGNLCANCHQPRRPWEYYANNEVAGNIPQTSPHFGPHHAPQATTVIGVGAAPIGTTAYPTENPHSAASCVVCHMPDANHSFMPNVDGCNTTGCHDGVNLSNRDKDDLDGDSNVVVKLATLKDKLIAEGLLIEVDGEIEFVTGTFPADYVGALYNYEWVLEDRSNGIHNFGYVDAMLDNAIEVLP